MLEVQLYIIFVGTGIIFPALEAFPAFGPKNTQVRNK